MRLFDFLRSTFRRGEHLVHDDISNGREYHKIPALSYKRNDEAPLDFRYVNDYVLFSPIDINKSLSNVASCGCLDNCASGECGCAPYVYNSEGRLGPKYNVNAPEVITECNAGCSCNRKTCQKMVIQNGCRAKVVLFRTKSRGWGVRTVERLKRGTFLGVYSGELVTARDSFKRKDDTYLFNLANTQIINQSEEQQQVQLEEQLEEEQEDPSNGPALVEDVETIDSEDEAEGGAQPEEKSETFVCDAKHYGNFTRFINHSCEPNVIGIRSFTVHQDKRIPYISFFTNRDVAANKELLLNYGDNYWLVKIKRDGVHCLCKRPSCKFSNQ